MGFLWPESWLALIFRYLASEDGTVFSMIRQGKKDAADAHEFRVAREVKMKGSAEGSRTLHQGADIKVERPRVIAPASICNSGLFHV